MDRRPARNLFLFNAILALVVLLTGSAASAGELSMGRSSHSISNIFGSGADRVSRTALNPRWRAAGWPRIKREGGPWAQIAREARALRKEERPALINRWVNGALRFRADLDHYGEADHWADIAESMASGEGDCEDYVIAKLQLLRALGYSARDLYILIVRDTAQDQDHAVLVVRSARGFVLLDNQRDEVADPAAFAGYRPMIGFNGSSAWLYRQALTLVTARTPAS